MASFSEHEAHQGAQDCGDHLSHVDDVAPVEDVVEEEACRATTKGAGHREHCPLSRLKPP